MAGIENESSDGTSNESDKVLDEHTLGLVASLKKSQITDGAGVKGSNKKSNSLLSILPVSMDVDGDKMSLVELMNAYDDAKDNGKDESKVKKKSKV